MNQQRHTLYCLDGCAPEAFGRLVTEADPGVFAANALKIRRAREAHRCDFGHRTQIFPDGRFAA